MGRKVRQDLDWGTAAPSDDTTLDLRGIIGLLRRQSRLILLTVVIILAATSIFVFSLTPSYQASTLVLVDTTRKDLLGPEAQMGSAQADSARVDSEVEILKSNAVLMDVVASQNLISDPEFGVQLGWKDRLAIALRLKDDQAPTGLGSPSAVMGKLASAVTIQRIGMTYIVSINVRSVSAQKAAQIANAIADVYINRQVQSKVDATLVRRDAIRDQIAVARQSVVTAENQYTAFITENLDQLVGASGQANLQKLRDDLKQQMADQIVASKEMDAIRRGVTDRDTSLLAEQLQSQAAKELARQRQAIVASLGQSKTTGTQAINLRLELSQIDRTLTSEAQKRIEELEKSISSNQARLSQTRSELNAAIPQTNLPPDVQARLLGFLQNSSSATSSYQALLSRLQDLETQASLQVADSRVVSPALTPTGPSYPRTSLILAAAGMLAVGVGVGLGFLFDNFIGGFTSVAQVQAVTRRNLATVIPQQKKDQNQPSVADTIISRPISRYSEGIRRLQASLERSLNAWRSGDRREGDQASTIMVTSALPSEGKTTISLSLARSLAMSGKRVLLIDCDLRRPSVHKHIGLSPSASLPDLLNGKLTRDEVQNVTIKDPKTNLRIILGKRDPDTAADQLLNRHTFAQLIEAVSRLFDYVILDSPPIEPVVDGVYISEHADAIAFVVQAAKTPQSLVLTALKVLDEAKPQGSEILIALNREVEDRLTSYRGYNRYYAD